MRLRIATMEETIRYLREPWISVPFLPPEWKLMPNEVRMIMALYRKRGIHLSRDSLIVAVYGEYSAPKNRIVSVIISQINRSLRKAGSLVTISSNRSYDVRYWLDTASIYELDYLLDLSTKPIPYRSKP